MSSWTRAGSLPASSSPVPKVSLEVTRSSVRRAAFWKGVRVGPWEPPSSTLVVICNQSQSRAPKSFGWIQSRLAARKPYLAVVIISFDRTCETSRVDDARGALTKR